MIQIYHFGGFFMKYCSTCGKEIQDAAVICPHCGCPTANYQATQQTNNVHTHSDYYPKLKEYAGRVNSIFVFSILSLALCMGIGIIFAIINLIKINTLKPFDYGKNLTNPTEIAEYNAIEKKLKTSRIMTAIGLGIAFILIFIIVVMSQM